MEKGNRFCVTVTALVAVLAISAGHCLAGSYTVTRVLAGDWLEVADNGSRTVIRLAGIDAPEMPRVKDGPGQPFCEKARQHLAYLVLDRSVTIQAVGTDRGGRTLAVVYWQKTNVNLEMVRAGLAQACRKGCSDRIDLTAYRQAEKKARQKLLGIWVLRDQYFSPSSWREIYGEHRIDP